MNSFVLDFLVVQWLDSWGVFSAGAHVKSVVRELKFYMLAVQQKKKKSVLLKLDIVTTILYYIN